MKEGGWKKEKFGLFKSKADLGEQKRRVNRRFFVFHAKKSGARGMLLGHLYSESQYHAELHANHFFAFMGKPLIVSKTMG